MSDLDVQIGLDQHLMQHEAHAQVAAYFRGECPEAAALMGLC